MGEYHQHIQSTSHHTQLADQSHPHRHHHLAGKQSAQIEEKFGFMETTTTDSFSKKEVHFFPCVRHRAIRSRGTAIRCYNLHFTRKALVGQEYHKCPD